MKTNTPHNIKCFLCLLIALIGLSANAITITYTHAGSTLEYSTSSTTCSVSRWISGAEVVIPETVNYQGVDYQVRDIAAEAFMDCSSITSINIPNTVTFIGYSAFQGCIGITSITIPNSVKMIRFGAFKGCSGLTSITIPNSLTELECYMFNGCTNLTSVEIPNTVKRIYYSTFSGCSSLTSITIPNTVKNIERYTFEGCTSLKSITIPSSVTSIEYGAFYKCSSLTSVVIPPSVTSVGTIAFDGCTGLKKSAYPSTIKNPFPSGIYVGYNPSGAVFEDGFIYGPSKSSILFVPITVEGDFVVPNLVNTIGANAFNGCSGLTSVVIPPSVTTIGNYAFNGCSGLTSVVIPPSVTTIVSSVFRGCSGLTSVVIPPSVTSIGANAFNGCSGLTSVVIPPSVTTIGTSAFDGCTGLRKSAYPSRLGNPFPSGICVGYDPSGAVIENGVIYGSSKSSILFAPYTTGNEFRMPSSVAAIGANAFKGCNDLTSVTIPGTVTSVGDFAFSDCGNLGELHLEDGDALLGLGINVLDGSPVNNLYIGRNWTVAGNETIGKDISRVTLGEKVTSLPHYAFSGCSGLTTVTIPASVTTIGHYAFSGCSGVQSVISQASRAPSIYKDSFEELYNRATLFIPKNSLNSYLVSNWMLFNSVKYADGDINLDTYSDGNLSYYLMMGANETGENSAVVKQGSHENLTSVVIPESITDGNSNNYCVTGICNNAFNGCTGLKSVKIANSVTSIGENAFKNCSGLTALTLPSSVTTIGDGAFSGCSSLPAVFIPSTVTFVGDGAFEGCSGLKKSAYPSSINNPFSNEVSIGYGPEASVIEDGVIYGLGKSSILYAPLTLEGKFDIPSSVISIGRHAFDGCSGLTSVVIPPSVTSIGQSAFADCSSLSSVSLNGSIKSIGDNTFANCQLTEVMLPPGVETIGSWAFAGNSGLDRIIMGCNVKTIGENAFMGANADVVFITAKTPPVASASAFSRYAGKLYVQGEAAVGAYHDAAACWDRFDVSRMSEPKMMIYEKPNSVNGLPGEQFTLKVTLIPSNVSLPYIFWRSTNPEKASVDGNGSVTVLQEITPEDNVEIIAETLYYNGPMAKFP